VTGMTFGFASMEENRKQLFDAMSDLVTGIHDTTKAVHWICQHWEGEASGAFQLAYQTWCDASHDLLADLNYLHKIVCQAQTNYASAHHAVVTVWGGEG
jgi:uncharacterized protein YukE